jgi:response regulator RpfG family c-di-GMP phosphodiesterase
MEQMESVACSVVVVEDDPIIGWDLRKQLDALLPGGVQYFDSQEQTSSYLRSHQPDLIITNLRLLDGWIDKAYYTALKSASKRLLILTGLRDERLHPDLEEAGKHSFLYKPFTSLQLRSCIQNLVSIVGN